jgi:aerobic-type carbon monoxide dehydrogenase small subunit (CoxS/CutS family)
METALKVIINGQPYTVTTDPRRTLLDVLREELHLTGTKYGCGEGVCGACTVLVDGRRTQACQTPIADAANHAVTTIEGLAAGGRLHPVQEAFLAEGAIQCGYCTPGMVLSTVALLHEKPRPTDAEIIAWMNDSLCRCCGYVKILNAVRRAARQVQKVKP